MREPDLQEVQEFKPGGFPGFAAALNKLRKPINALIRAAKRQGATRTTGTTRLVATVINDDNTVTLRVANVGDVQLGEEITSSTFS